MAPIAQPRKGGRPELTPRVSVVVPVYNPGHLIERCIDSILGQSLAAEEYEAIFVDDGSTDETPGRLDALAARHRNVRVIHQANSGWPGGPRNVGIDAARGEYIFFLDNDDALGPEALERMHALAVRNDADIVVGKMTGHGRSVARQPFRESRDRATLADSPLVDSLTPHKLFRRAFLVDHGLRFPEGRRRLEDHVFVLNAYFAARVISVLADYVCYYHYARPDRSNASLGPFDPPYYYGFLREVLGIVEAHTEPGPFRDSLLQRFARVELLDRLRGRRFLEHPPEYQAALLAEIRAVIGEHIPPSVDDLLAPHYRIRLTLVRAGRLDLIVAFAEAEARVQGRAHLRLVDWAPRRVLHLVVEAGVDGGDGPLGFERIGDRLLLRLPSPLEALVPEKVRQLPPPRSDPPTLTLRRRDDSAEVDVPVTVESRLLEGPDGWVVVVYSIDAALSPACLSPAGRPRDATWDVIARIGFLGVTREAAVEFGADQAARVRRPILGRHRPSMVPFRTGHGDLSLRVRRGSWRSYLGAARRLVSRLGG